MRCWVSNLNRPWARAAPTMPAVTMARAPWQVFPLNLVSLLELPALTFSESNLQPWWELRSLRIMGKGS